MSLYRCTKCQNVDNGEITYPHAQHLLSLGKQVDWHCTICLGKPWHNKFPIEKYRSGRHTVLNPLIEPRHYKFEIKIGSFLAPGQWRGYFSEAVVQGTTGSTTGTFIGASKLRDLNVSNFDIKGPMFFQVGIFSDIPHTSFLEIEIEDLGVFPYVETIQTGIVSRSFFGDGKTNIFDWFNARVGRKTDIDIWDNAM